MLANPAPSACVSARTRSCGPVRTVATVTAMSRDRSTRASASAVVEPARPTRRRTAAVLRGPFERDPRRDDGVARRDGVVQVLTGARDGGPQRRQVRLVEIDTVSPRRHRFGLGGPLFKGCPRPADEADGDHDQERDERHGGQSDDHPGHDAEDG